MRNIEDIYIYTHIGSPRGEGISSLRRTRKGVLQKVGFELSLKGSQEGEGAEHFRLGGQPLLWHRNGTYKVGK